MKGTRRLRRWIGLSAGTAAATALMLVGAPAPQPGISAPGAVGIELSEGTTMMDATAAVAAARTAAIPSLGAVRAVSGVMKTFTLVQCLAYEWRIKSGFACTSVSSGKFTTYIDGSRVWLNYPSGWQLSPYRYVASTNTARIDPALIKRPSVKTGMGSTQWTPVASRTPYWNPCDASLTWRADFTALKLALLRSGLSETSANARVAAELTRLKSAFSALASVGGWTFTYLGTGVFRTGGDSTPDAFGTAGTPDIIVSYGAQGDSFGYGTDMGTWTIGRAGSRFQETDTTTGARALKIINAYATFDYKYVMISANNPFKATVVDANRAVYLHELSHALGLGHVNDTMLMMNPMADPRVDDRLGAGDAAGLGMLGDRPCFV